MCAPKFSNVPFFPHSMRILNVNMDFAMIVTMNLNMISIWSLYGFKKRNGFHFFRKGP